MSTGGFFLLLLVLALLFAPKALGFILLVGVIVWLFGGFTSKK